MPRPARFALRFLFLVVAIGVVSTLVVPHAQSNNPYVSVLSPFAASYAHADPSCANKGCPIGSSGNCSHKAGFDGCALINGTCEDRMCL